MSTKRVWFHIIISTYGAWLPGDPRGFRTRHHREHVDGDYKNPPPPGIYDKQLQASQQRLKQPPVVLAPRWRQFVGEAIRDKLPSLNGHPLVISVSGQHVHLQLQLDDGDARIPVGRVKKHATFEAHNAGFTGELWAVRCKVVRIRDRDCQRNVYRYILNHRTEGAWVWSALEEKKMQQ